MTRNEKRSTHPIAVRLSIWSIRHQGWLTGQVRIYIIAATVLIAFLALAGVISIQTAIVSSVGIGLISIGLIWTLVQRRKAILLNIKEPEARAQAHQAMVEYLQEVYPDIYTPMDISDASQNHQKDPQECGLP